MKPEDYKSDRCKEMEKSKKDFIQRETLLVDFNINILFYESVDIPGSILAL